MKSGWEYVFTFQQFPLEAATLNRCNLSNIKQNTVKHNNKNQ